MMVKCGALIKTDLSHDFMQANKGTSITNKQTSKHKDLQATSKQTANKQTVRGTN